MISPELVITNDGSHSLYRADLDEHYHSMHGAITESMHIFIKNGLLSTGKNKQQVFEMGFGTGLNAFLTWITAREKGIRIDYYSIEKYPLTAELARNLNYSSMVSPGDTAIFHSMHDSEWNGCTSFGDFNLHKILADLLEYDIPGGNDLVYFDAFSPDKEPGLWTHLVLQRIYESMNPGGIFVTYTAKGEVKRKLQSVGFRTERLAGPPGKKHMLRAVK